MKNTSTLIRQFIIDSFLFGSDEDLTDDTSFLEEGIIDSTGVLELVAFIEENFSIHIEDNELIPENLDTIRNVATFISNKTGASAVAV
jgi:acyl carrier protein